MPKYTGKRVRANMTLAERLDFYSMPEPNSGCLLWLASVNMQQYGSLFWEGANRGAHVLAWEIANKRRVPSGLFVCHKCDVPSCIEPTHLFLGTQRQNLADMIAKKRSPRGIARPNAKLTDALVREIRSSKEPMTVFAERHGIGYTIALRVRRGERWTHVTDREN